MLILITPVRNEEKFLPGLIDSVLSQSLRPSLYVIVDHGSTDGSPEIIHDITEKEGWVKSIRLEGAEGGYSAAVRAGLEYAEKLVIEEGVGAEFYGIVDAEIRLPPDYFERIIEKFREESELGMASGSIFLNGKRLYQEPERPWGACLVMSDACLRAIGGFPDGPAPDSVAVVLARNRGFATHQFPDIRVEMLREMRAREGLRRGYFERGRASAYLGETLLMALAKAVFHSRPPHPLKGLSFLYGYLRMRLRERRRAPDEVREYYGKKSPLRLMRRRISKKN